MPAEYVFLLLSVEAVRSVLVESALSLVVPLYSPLQKWLAQFRLALLIQLCHRSPSTSQMRSLCSGAPKRF